MSLVDPEAAPLRHSLRQLGLDLLCTNRDLPLSMPVGKQHTDFTLAVSAPVAGVRCLVGPTAPRPCRSDGEYAWRFISHLGLNYLSLVDTDELQGAASLRELLRLYVPSQTSVAARQLEAAHLGRVAPDRAAHSGRRAGRGAGGGWRSRSPSTRHRSAARARSCSAPCSTGSSPNTSRSTPSPKRSCATPSGAR